MFSNFSEEISGGAYDKRDLDRFNSDDIYAGCFLRTLASKGDPDKALDNVGECFKFRKEIGINGKHDIKGLLCTPRTAVTSHCIKKLWDFAGGLRRIYTQKLSKISKKKIEIK